MVQPYTAELDPLTAAFPQELHVAVGRMNIHGTQGVELQEGKRKQLCSSQHTEYSLIVQTDI